MKAIHLIGVGAGPNLELMDELAAGLARTFRISCHVREQPLDAAFAFDPARGELLRGGQPVKVTTRERDLLRTLIDHAGAIVSRQTLAQRAAEHSASERSVDVEIARLRRKIEDDPNAPRHLQTVRGQGYRLLVEPPRVKHIQS